MTPLEGLFELIVRQGWPLPVGLKVDETKDYFDLIVDYEDDRYAS